MPVDRNDKSANSKVIKYEDRLTNILIILIIIKLLNLINSDIDIFN
jgi:hypothetical protein